MSFAILTSMPTRVAQLWAVKLQRALKFFGLTDQPTRFREWNKSYQPSHMQYQRFDPSSYGFPTPRVPVLPALGLRSLGRAKSRDFKPVDSDHNVRFFSRGRYALTEAYRLAGIGPGTTLLAPAYHCRTMLDPAIRLGGNIGLYRLNPDLSPDLTTLAAAFAECVNPVKALLVTHYFGCAQTLKLLADFCQQRGITLIEDCSHAMFTTSAQGSDDTGYSIGQTGHFCVASPYKFFPSEDGGVLWANGPSIPAYSQQCAQPIAQELKGVVHALQRARIQAKDGRIAPPHNGKAMRAPLFTARDDTLAQSATTSPHYQPEQEHLKSLAISRWVIRHTDTNRLATRRRQNYATWAAAVANLPYCRALFPRLRPDCVPYMFPLLIDHPNVHFIALKQLGVPIWRWDDMAVSDCPTASSYRLRLLHLPCHQELTDKQMAWMTSTLGSVMTQMPAERS